MNTIKKASFLGPDHQLSKPIKVGILGGGQLARMLAIKGHELGLEVHILSEKATDPAAQVVKHFHAGNPNSAKDLYAFFQAVDLVTFESEFYSGDLLADISRETKTPVHPRPQTMSLLQDRLTQKQSLLDHQIPTADFIEIYTEKDLALAAKEFKNKFVLKKRRGGYDGNGTFVFKNEKDIQSFLKKNEIIANEYIAEEFIPFKQECAVMMAQNSQHELVNFPLVKTQQTEHRCDWVIGPVKHPKFNQLVLDLAVYLDSIHYTGVIAFELFDTGKKLLVNEIAPRVHNSAHYSLDAMNVDQFTMHWMAILNFNFFEPKSISKAFAMTNLIGESNKEVTLNKNITGKLHWYGKHENRPGRKMGHINYVGNNAQSILKIALSERKSFKNLGPK